MANNGIKGITIEIGGDTRGLESALKDVNKQSKDLQTELKAVEKGLKLDPGNVELVRQKQELLTQSIQSTSQKLDTLKTAQAQVQAQFDRGDIGVEQYRAFQRELQSTEGEMNRLQGQLNSLGAEQDRLAQTTRQLGTFFEATNTDVEQFAGTLGTRLTQAIRDGSASADQMERALRLMGQQALGAGVDVDRLREALRTADDGANLNQLRQDLAQITEEAGTAENAVNGFGQELSSVVGGLAAGGGIAGVVSKALDTSSLKTMIDISFNVPEESKQSIFDAVKSIEVYGVEGEEALEGIRRQWALNKDATDESNASLVQGAAVVAKAYAGIDFIELIQETNEIASSLEISNEEALALTNSLLKFGFPPEQLDTISEYGLQMKAIGFSTAEIQSIFEAGVDTKSWNIDNLNDGVKEARITMSEFGLEVDKSTAALLNGTGLSAAQLKDWGKSVAGGGEEGAVAMSKVSEWLKTIEDDALRNELAIKVFGTKAEDQVGNMIAVFEGLADAQDKNAQNQDELNGAIDRMNQDPLVMMKDALADVMSALMPLLTMVATFVSQIASWVSENATLAATIVAIGAVLGILTGAFAALMPAIGALFSMWPALVLAIGGISAPILIAVGAIVGLGAAFIALWQNSETFRDNLTSVFEAIKSVVVTVFETVASFIGDKISQIKQFWNTEGAQILQAAENIFNGIKSVIETVMPAIQFVIDYVWKAIKQVITGALDVIMGAVKVFSGLFTGDFGKMWEGVKQIFSGAIDLIIGWLSLTFVGGIRTLLTNLGKTGISLVKGMWDDIVKLFTDLGSKASGAVSGMVSGVVGFFKNLLTNAQSIFGTMRTFGATAFEALKTVAINAASKLLAGVKTSFTNMLTAIKTTMGNVQTSVSELWGKVIAIFKPDALLQVGKDVVNGLIKGISGMFDGVRKTVEKLAALIPEWARDILDIHSPSRVMGKIGEQISEGLAVGIEDKAPSIKKKMESIAKITTDIATNNAKEVAAIADKAEAERTKIQETYATKQKNLKKATSSQIQALEKEMQEKLDTINTKAWADMQKKESEISSQKLVAIKQYLEDKKSTEQLSLVAEAQIWEQSMAMFNGSTKERIEAQKLYKTAVEAVNKELVAINEDYSKQIEKVNEDLVKQEETLTKAYEDAVDKRASSLYSFKNLFDEFKVEIDTTGDQLLVNLGTQVEGFKAWQREIEALSSKAIDKGLLAELREMGPNALPELIALNSMTSTQLTQYSNLYKEKSALARTQAETELIGMKNDTDTQIKALRTAANTQLDALQKEWTSKIKSLTKTTSTELSSLKQIGVDAGRGLLDGLTSMEGSLVRKATQIANAISGAIQSALDIHSPSRVMKGFGVNIGQGLIVGMDDMIGKVAKSSVRLSDAVQGAYGSLASSASKSVAANSYNQVSSTSTIDNSKYMQPNITIINQSPNVSPSEIARKALQTQRQLAMEWGV